MSSKRTVVITTELPPAMCGIGTYSWLLRTKMPNESSHVEFLVHRNAPRATTTPLNDRVICFDGDARKLARALHEIGEADVLLHYAGRAYHRFGAPNWLPRVLTNWKGKFPGGRIMIVVHELPASFSITSRHFWLGKLSERVAAQLGRLADVLITNSTHHMDRLRKISGRSDIHFLPNPSNIEKSAADETRARTEFVVFGLPFGRLQTLQLFHARIRAWHADGVLTKLHLIGPADEKFTKEAAALVDASLVEQHGELAPPEIAALLRRAGFALTNASEETWSKSTSLMACVLNECPIVVATTPSGAGPFSLTIGADEVGRISDAELDRRTSEFAEWYRAKADWPVIATQVASLWPNERSK